MRVHRLVAVVVMADEMVEPGCFGDSGPLIEFARVRPEVWIVDQATPITFEVAVIDEVETCEVV